MYEKELKIILSSIYKLREMGYPEKELSAIAAMAIGSYFSIVVDDSLNDVITRLETTMSKFMIRLRNEQGAMIE